MKNFIEKNINIVVLILLFLPLFGLIIYFFYRNVFLLYFLILLLILIFIFTLFKISFFEIKKDKIYEKILVNIFASFYGFAILFATGFSIEGIFMCLFFLYFIVFINYQEKVLFILYLLYKRYLSSIVNYIIKIFNKVYYILLQILFIFLIFFFSFFVVNKNILNYDFLYLIKLNFYDKLDSSIFISLFLKNLLFILFLFFLKYIKNILSFLNLILFNYISFFVLILLYLYDFIYHINLDKVDFFIIYSEFTKAIFIFYFLYIIISPISLFNKIKIEGKNKQFKKFYNENNIQTLCFSFTKIRNIFKEDKVFETIKIFFKDLKQNLDKYDDYYISESNYITFLDDNPIKLGDTDILNIQDFTKNLAEVIDGVSFNNKITSFSIGIVGERGLGKSSVINLLKDKYIDGNPNFKIMNFNPWNYEKKDLIEKFFDDLSLVIGLKGFINIKNDYLNALGEIHNYFKLLGIFNKNKTTDEIKEDLNIKLKELGNRKIIIVIDDLDRCEPKEILVVLNIIKNLGNLSNIIYIVSYDKEKIIKVLDKEGFDGDYLDKIINFERYLPITTKAQLKDYFENELKTILKDIFPDLFIGNNENIDMLLPIENLLIGILNDLSYIFEKENLRFLKKLLNHLNIIFKVNKESFTNIIDVQDLQNIIIVNYVKLKDYIFFKEFYEFYLENKIQIYFNKENIPKIFLNIFNGIESDINKKILKLYFNFEINENRIGIFPERFNINAKKILEKIN